MSFFSALSGQVESTLAVAAFANASAFSLLGIPTRAGTQTSVTFLAAFLYFDNYPKPTIDDILPQLTKAKVFSIMDAKGAFSNWMKPAAYLWLSRYLSESFDGYAISPAPDIFQRRIHEALSCLSGVLCIADDMVVYDSGDSLNEAIQDHDMNINKLLDICRKFNLRLNKIK